MFNFGGTEQTVALYYESMGRIGGPGVPEGHYSEMSEEDLRALFVYLYDALRSALEDGVEDAVVESITEDYDEVFLALVEASDGFRSAVETGKHTTPFGYKLEKANKYRKLAGVRLIRP